MKKGGKGWIVVIGVFALLVFTNLALQYSFFRWDMTAEKRYSISPHTKKLLHDLQEPVEVTIYLDGDLNPGFTHLRNSLCDLLDELNAYAKEPVSYHMVNPSESKEEKKRVAMYTSLMERGLSPTTIYERDGEGKRMEKMVFPWALVVCGNDTMAVHLLENIPSHSGTDNLNISVEMLEWKLVDALHVIGNKEVRKVAFIEGHDELNEDYTYSASARMSRYFQVDRGVLGGDATVLDDYEAIIVADPQGKFSEEDKYIIDQYIMHGGKVMWLIDGVYVSMNELIEKGASPMVENNNNLTDMLFRYGIKINPVLVQDVQCEYMPMNVSSTNEPEYEAMPWYYAPLLLPSPNHAITRNLSQVKANFCSTISFTGDDADVRKEVLLVSSNASHTQAVPSMVDLSLMPEGNDNSYFNEQYLPVAAFMEGRFHSVFQNRLVPEGITNTTTPIYESEPTKMVVVADGDVIRNDMANTGNGYQPLPMGYDRYTGIEFGNGDFVMNALLYLTDDDGWMSLRNRSFKVRQLNKALVSSHYKLIKWLNTLLPLLLVLVGGVVYNIVRRRKYKNM